MIKKQLQETVHSTLLLGCFYLLYMLYSNLSPGVLLLVLSCVVCIAVFSLDAGLLARSLYSEGPAIGHLDTKFFLGSPMSISKCCGSSKHSKFPLRASHVALKTQIY